MWGTIAVETELARGAGELRDRLHALELAHQELEELVDAMTKAEELEQAIAGAIRTERQTLLTWPRKIAAGVVALLLVVPALHELVLWVSG